MLRSFIRPVGLCLMVVLVILVAAVRAQEPQPPNQAQIDRERAIEVVRAINAAESDYRTAHGRFAFWYEVRNFRLVTPGTQITLFPHPWWSEEVIPGYRLTLLVADEGKAYSVSLHDMKANGCGLSVFSDQSGLIYQGTTVDCTQFNEIPPDRVNRK
jgi:hypothetical protein